MSQALITSAGSAETVAALLAGYRPEGGFLLAAPERTLLASDTLFAVPPSVRGGHPCGHADLPARVAAALDLAQAAGQRDPMVVGAVPFSPDGAVRLAVPRQVEVGAPVSAAAPVTPAAAPVTTHPEITAEPRPEVYTDAVAKAVRRMRAGELTKVVLARSLRLLSAEPVRVDALVRNLAAANPGGYTFAADLGRGSTLLGASPELLVSRRGALVRANPLAGSAPRTGDPAEDDRRAAALLASAKDRHEHAVVVDAVRAGLAPLCSTLDIPATPSVVHTPTMLHLSTMVTGEVRDERTSALELALALHPTPAVCGTPVDAARAVISELEPVDRGFYSGMVGWTDRQGDGDWIVTIRCGVAEANAIRLYAGAGCVADSDPAAELAETSAKFQTLLRGLGL